MKFALASLAVLVVVGLVGLAGEDTEAATVQSSGCLAYAKEYMVKLFRDKVLSRSEIVKEFNKTVERTKQIYEAKIKSGEIDETDPEAAAAKYKKILIDELRTLLIDVKIKQPVDNTLANLEEQIEEEDKYYDACTRFNDNVLKPGDIDKDAEKEELEELELLGAWDDIEKEKEMGWSLDPENKRKIEQRTRQVLDDLLSNEVRQLALAVMSSYMTGGTVAPIMAAVTAALKSKLLEYFLHIVFDLLSSMMGREIVVGDATESPFVLNAAPAVTQSPSLQVEVSA